MAAVRRRQTPAASFLLCYGAVLVQRCYDGHSLMVLFRCILGAVLLGCLIGAAWTLLGRCLGAAWALLGRYLGAAWALLGRCLLAV